ncbi:MULTISPECIES: 2OG-Fe(II) oxygenase [unclassified Arcicella]|uniref:2OG-Fe(II) oxygenase n=1 Tax=unclassified Arcicella TaxID=2644986 RepID=UPI002854C1E2|nr:MULTISPECIES: 2OG-Fe(II) oxygenase [unclassified Arcicella]MDR6563637.1 SM-20-related protein [Arcicella sp. BE51]MDR6814225.1 SM-20-related protein [Arcicella sp. BE140]MDR6825536.1 SM-20-related protein [Arcicella sp. BE139]
MLTQEEKFEGLIEGILANGYGVCDDFLSLEEVKSLSTRFETRFDAGNFKEAGIGKQSEVHTATAIRGDKILWLESNSIDLSERILLDKNQAFIDYLNQTCYLGIIDSEIHFAKYEVGKFYRRHRDTFQAQKGRILSVIYYLNIDWLPENGGNLLIYTQENNQEKIIRIAPLAGRLVCFESEKLDHEVCETFKERLSITGWLLNC